MKELYSEVMECNHEGGETLQMNAFRFGNNNDVVERFNPYDEEVLQVNEIIEVWDGKFD